MVTLLIHKIVKIKAEYQNSAAANDSWVNIYFTNDKGEDVEVTFFTSDDALARDFAQAIAESSDA